jgi:nucleoside-diphosphate-sugar epimerase
MLYLADYEVLSIRDMANELAGAMKVRKPFTMPLPMAHLLAKCGDLICLTGRKFPFQSKRLANMRLEYVYDMSATKAVCGPLPYSFQEGVKIFADWYLTEINSHK